MGNPRPAPTTDMTGDTTMAEATDTTRAPDARPASNPHLDPLPYAHLDIVGRGADEYCAGGAMLAELTRGWVETRPAADAMGDAEREALGEAATAHEERQLAEMACPSQDLGEVAAKLAYALRLGWHAMSGNGPYGDASLSFIGMALSDVILLREAEAQRRHKDRPAGRAS